VIEYARGPEDDERVNTETGEIVRFPYVMSVEEQYTDEIGRQPDASEVPQQVRETPRFVAPDWDDVLHSGTNGQGEILREFWQRWHNCTACPLSDQGRTRVVLGAGAPGNAKYILIGEGPGANEDQEGVPFVGHTGKKLSRALNETGINRVRECYLANAVCCWPPGNRNPSKDEVLACRPRLKEQMGRLLAVGKTRVVVLIGKPAYVTFMMGNELSKPDFKIDSVKMKNVLGWVESPALEKFPCRVYSTYHPSYISRREHVPGEWQAWLRDWDAIKRYAEDGILIHPRGRA
jgi:DNA polymerase